MLLRVAEGCRVKGGIVNLQALSVMINVLSLFKGVIDVKTVILLGDK
jgi:hypothetical protein